MVSSGLQSLRCQTLSRQPCQTLLPTTFTRTWTIWRSVCKHILSKKFLRSQDDVMAGNMTPNKPTTKDLLLSFQIFHGRHQRQAQDIRRIIPGRPHGQSPPYNFSSFVAGPDPPDPPGTIAARFLPSLSLPFATLVLHRPNVRAIPTSFRPAPWPTCLAGLGLVIVSL